MNTVQDFLPFSTIPIIFTFPANTVHIFFLILLNLAKNQFTITFNITDLVLVHNFQLND